MAETKRWRVRGPRYGFKRTDGTWLLAGAVFEATDAEVKGQEYKLEAVDQYTMPDAPPREAAPATTSVKPRGRKLDRMVRQPPESTVM